MNKFLEEYSERLTKWNFNEKYSNEMIFLEELLLIKSKDVILDYGCGIGTLIKHLKSNYKNKIYGHDVNHFSAAVTEEWFLKEINGKFNKIFFMHSLAHIPNASATLMEIKKNLIDEKLIYVITPNKSFDDYFKKEKKEKNYKSDLTVVEHYTSESLATLFQLSGYDIVNQGQFGKIENNHFERLFLIARCNS